MNQTIGRVGALLATVSVLLFAVSMLIPFEFGSYFVCIFLALSFVLMIATFENECTKENKVAGKVAMTFSAIYATLIVIVYFTQCTTVQNEVLSDTVKQVLDYKRFGLLFNIDLLGYGMMALSTFFIGLTIDVRSKKDKALKILLLLHGIFFISCLIMPMLGIFKPSDGTTTSGGVIAMEIWCLYFLPIGILSFLHFKERK